MEITQKYANNIGWSDVTPYEIVRVVSDKTLEIREMKCTKGDWEMDFVPGGFFGTVVNQTAQKWIIESNPDAPVVRIRLSKNKGWRCAGGGQYQLSDNPRKFYDYNF